MSSVHRFKGSAIDFDWENVPSIQFPEGRASKASGRIMIGKDDGAPYFVFRYFLIQPGGHSTLDDFHAHDHGVLILHGKARVVVEDLEYELGPNDVIYISPWERHSLTPIGNEPLGFLCVIPNKELLSQLEDPD